MKDPIICCIADQNELFQVLVMADSARVFLPTCQVYCMIPNGGKRLLIENKKKYPAIQWVRPSEILNFKDGLFLKIKYGWFSSQRAYFGSLTPFFVRQMVIKYHSRVIYCNPTSFFIARPKELLESLDIHDVILVPNGFTLSPNENFEEFTRHFLEGYYTSGLIGFSKNSVAQLDWWAKVCRFACEKKNIKGYYYEQAYLNFLPVMYENIKVIHTGTYICQATQLKRLLDSDQQVSLINFDIEAIKILQAFQSNERMSSLLQAYFASYHKFK